MSENEGMMTRREVLELWAEYMLQARFGPPLTGSADIAMALQYVLNEFTTPERELAHELALLMNAEREEESA